LAKLFVIIAILVAIRCSWTPAKAGAAVPAMAAAGGLPSVGPLSAGNSAGVVQYCLDHKLVSSTSADAVLTRLGNKKSSSSPDYVAGSLGRMVGAHGRTLTIADLPGHQKSQACDIALRQARHHL
jgi:hypothetical protein